MSVRPLFQPPWLAQYHRKHPVKQLICLLALAGTLFTLPMASVAAPDSAPGGAQAPVVTAFPVMETSVQQKILALGNLSANQSVDITPQINGRIVSLNLQDGGYVKSGTLLVEMDGREQTAVVEKARINLQDAKRQLTNMEALNKKKAISIDELKAQKATVDGLAATLQAEQVKLDHYTLEAPFAGKLSFHNVSAGALINAGSIITTLDDLSTMKLDFSLPENSLSHIDIGTLVSATSDAWPGETFLGTVTSISPRIDPINLTFQVRAQMDNASQQLRPGMLMKTSIQRSAIERLVVPSRSILFDGNRRFVFVIDEQSKVEKRLITTGDTIDEFIVVLSGLASGEMVVNEGIVKVSDGRPVKILSSDQPRITANPQPSSLTEGLL
ncbi:efflux RND transporter periplasmic adaptor subunit [uncultured Endozoicomonas sp.]|uniref:efflux RND transporter periplasmic adaptor subunit n=1 Tax=uncultured Endozoicomonas sp. TaxID=432652 RepID=UPI0026154273|nr:efflux RND transporter periplasmic adaptor subunit [uncultured Endozoicomonas sp.]